METQPVERSPQKLARIAGVLYLIIIATGLFGELFVRGKLIVSGDATATAANILASQTLWRLGIVGDLIMHVCDVPLMLIFYVLLRPVDKTLALLAMLFNMVQTATLVAFKLALVVALFILGSGPYLKAFEPGQLQALMYLLLRADGTGFAVGLIFFGCTCLVNGLLIRRSGYLPKTLGVLLQIAGVCYLVNSFTLLLVARVPDMLIAILIPAFIGELSLCLWLLAKGVNVERWSGSTSD